MKSISYLVAGLLAVLGLNVSPAAADDTWLNLKRSDLPALLTFEKSELFKIELWEAQLERFRDTAPPRAVKNLEAEKSRLSEKLEAGESIWVALGDAIPSGMVLIGKDDRIHTIRITVPVIAYAAPERSKPLFESLAKVFQRIYPTWPDASEWPMKSLKASWDRTAATMDAPGKIPQNKNDLIAWQKSDGVVSATFGVPPDIVAFTATVREKCIPDMERGNPMANAAC